MRIYPSLLNADWAQFGASSKQVLDAGAYGLHLDVMDNHYVPNLTFGPSLVASLKNYGIEAFMDVHLMVEPVDALIESFAKAGASRITFHPEATRHVERSLALAKQLGVEAGLALNPSTPLDVLDFVWHTLDHVLIMSVNPGFGGQAFIGSALDKIKQIHALIQANKTSVSLSVDGGINSQNLLQVRDAGAGECVVGSAIFGSADPAQAVRELLQLLAP